MPKRSKVAMVDTLQSKADELAQDLEGFKIEVVGDRIVMTPQSNVQSWTIFEVRDALREGGVAKHRILSDVEIVFPGDAKRCPDVAVVEAGATDPYSYEDLLAAVEIVSTRDDVKDYEIKHRQYAAFGVPTYLIIDPFRGECDLYTAPDAGRYTHRETITYGKTVSLPLPDGLTAAIPTSDFQRRD